MKSDAEIKQAIIANLVACRAVTEPDSVDATLMSDALTSWIHFDADFDLHIPPGADVQQVVTDAVNEYVTTISRRMEAQVTVGLHFLGELFLRVASEYENIYPDADVDGFLRRAALAVADDGGEPDGV